MDQGRVPLGLSASPGALSRAIPRTVSEWLESSALDHIVRRVAYSHRILSAEIDDLLQEVRIALWEVDSRAEIKPAWVFGTASHKAVDVLRRRRKRRERAIAALPLAGDRDSELMCLVRAQIAQLPERLRVYCGLRYVEGLTEREISSQMGICRASVRWLGVQCLRALILGR